MSHKKPRSLVIDEISASDQAIHQLKRFFGIAGISLLFTTLAVFTLWLLYQRLYVVQSLSAVVEAPVVAIRAPQASYFQPIHDDNPVQVKQGEPVAFMELIGGGAITVDSPCHCQLLNHHVLPGQFVALGEPLITLLPTNATPYITMQADVSEAQKITIGDPAIVKLSNGSRFSGEVRKVRFNDTIERRHSAPLSKPSVNAVSYAEVLIEPGRSFTNGVAG